MTADLGFQVTELSDAVTGKRVLFKDDINTSDPAVGPSQFILFISSRHRFRSQLRDVVLPNPLTTDPSFDPAPCQAAAPGESVGLSDTTDIGQFQRRLPGFQKPGQLFDELTTVGGIKIERVIFQQQGHRAGIAGGEVLLHFSGSTHTGVVLGEFREQPVTQRRVIPDPPRGKRCHQQHTGHPDCRRIPHQRLGQAIPTGLDGIAAEPAPKRIVGGHPASTSFATSSRPTRPECPPVGQTQQRRRERQRRRQYHGQSKRDADPCLSKFPKLREDHHANPTHHGAGTRRQRRTDSRECPPQCGRDRNLRPDSSRRRGHQFLPVPCDQEEAVVHPRPVTQHGHIDLNATEQVDNPPQGPQLQQVHRDFNRHRDGHHWNQRDHRGPVQQQQQNDNQDDRPEFRRGSTLVTGPQHVATDGGLPTGRDSQPLLDDPRFQPRLPPDRPVGRPECPNRLRDLVANQSLNRINRLPVLSIEELCCQFDNHQRCPAVTALQQIADLAITESPHVVDQRAGSGLAGFVLLNVISRILLLGQSPHRLGQFDKSRSQHLVDETVIVVVELFAFGLATDHDHDTTRNRFPPRSLEQILATPAGSIGWQESEFTRGDHVVECRSRPGTGQQQQQPTGQPRGPKTEDEGGQTGEHGQDRFEKTSPRDTAVPHQDRRHDKDHRFGQSILAGIIRTNSTAFQFHPCGRNPVGKI